MAMTSTRNALENLLREVEQDVDDQADDKDLQRLTPSLDKLNADQRAWLSTWGSEGYSSRRRLILALHQMEFWSLGRVPDAWYVHLCSRGVSLSILITSDRRTIYRQDPVDLETARRERQYLAAKYVRPAFRAAFRTLRKDAKEYTDEDQQVDDVDSQQSFAMRPALDELYSKQSKQLLALLDGFKDMDAVDDWLSRLDQGTLGELYRVEPDFDWKIHDRMTAQRTLLEDDRKYEMERELWAATYLLPSFNRAVQRWAEQVDEHVEDGDYEGMETKSI